MMFKDLIIWITGASSGIGAALALNLNEKGAIIIASAPFENELEVVQKKARYPEKFHCLPLDLLRSDELSVLAKKVLQNFGHVDILINNAGISQRSLTAETLIETDRKIMEINYFGALILTKALLPSMLERRKGYILCTTSMVGRFGFPLRSAYSAAKHAQFGFFETLRAEYYDQGIDVSMIIGGRIQTNISLHALNKDGSEHGKMDSGQKGGISAERAAEIIVKGMTKKKREIKVGGKELLILPIKRFFPSLHFKIIRNIKHT